MKLYLPGPTNVREDVLQQFLKPLIGHRTKDATELQKSISENAQKIMGTKNEILLSTSSGTGLMEGAIRSCTTKKALICSVGSFGEKWYRIGCSNGIDTDKLESELGQPTDPDQLENMLQKHNYDFVGITHNETATGLENNLQELAEVMNRYPEIVWALDGVSSVGGVEIPADQLGIDILITSSQKCLGLPPGMSLCSFSEKAVQQARKVEHRGTYFDLLDLYNTLFIKDYQYTNTPAISNMFAMEYQFDYIINEEGLNNRFRRHIEMAEYIRDWAKKYFDLFADEKYLSKTATCIKNVRNIDVEKLIEELDKRGITLSNGFGPLKNQTFRIGHMGDMTINDMKILTRNIEEVLGL
ncbi:MAG: alanine--glyoxylate aminotransferase family protein [Tissierellia bacterium]|nr:alanine--glyoxylate aminotransferase family protein [Tissierellia bacterium]